MIEIDQLKDIKAFQGLSDEALASLADSLQSRTYSAQEPIFREGVPGGDLYLVAEGAVKVSKKAKEGEAQSLALITKGQYVGIMTFLAGGKHSADATAQGHCVLYLLDRRTFDRFTESFPTDSVKLLKHFMEELITRLRDMNERYIDMVNYMWRWR